VAVEHSYETLVDYFHTGAQAERVTASSPEVTFSPATEAFQVHAIDLYPPKDGGGNLENLWLALLVDGVELELLHWDTRMLQALNPASKIEIILLGDRYSTNPLLNVLPKGNSRLQVKTYGGPAGVTGDYRVKVRGDYFNGDAALLKFFAPATAFGEDAVQVYDPIRGRAMTVLRPVPLAIGSWPDVCGGAFRAAKPRILPWITAARNKNATTPSTDYLLSSGLASVDQPWENLDLNLDSRTGILIERLGVLPHGNSRYLKPRIGGDFIPRAPNYFDVRLNTNELPMGIAELQYQGPRRLEKPIWSTNEKLEIYLTDNGAAVAVNGFLVAVWGKRIELP